MLERQWRTLKDIEVPDIKSAIVSAVGDGDKIVHIGTDAQKRDKRIDFVTAIVILTPGRGGRGFYTREKDPKFNSLRQKLVKEAWNSIKMDSETTILWK